MQYVKSIFSVMILFLFLSLIPSRQTFAQESIPYSTRTLNYPAWSSTVKGDHKTVGMAGAMVGLANTKLSVIDNPAGLAMTLDDTGIEFSRNLVKDQHIQLTDEVQFTDFAGAISTYPWGFGYAAWTPLIEKKEYTTPGSVTLTPSIESVEYRISIARVLLKNRLALGVSFLYAKSNQSLFVESAGQNYTGSFSNWSMSLGAMVQFPRRWLLGLSYHFPFTTTSDLNGTTTGITDFFQSSQSPSRLGLGVGWIPNRYFQFGASIYFIGKSQNVSLLRSEDARVGQAVTFQPRVGMSYQWADYKEFEGYFGVGTYWEVTRIVDQNDRPHFTTGLQIRPWVLSFGWTLDVASDFSNQIITAGVDLGKIFKKLGLIPRGYQPPRSGMLPKFDRLSDHGLPRPLVKNWKKRQKQSLDLIDTGRNIPANLEKGLKNTKDGIGDFFKSIGSIPGKISDGMKRLNKNPKKKKSKKSKQTKSSKKKQKTNTTKKKPSVTPKKSLNKKQ